MSELEAVQRDLLAQLTECSCALSRACDATTTELAAEVQEQWEVRYATTALHARSPLFSSTQNDGVQQAESAVDEEHLTATLSARFAADESEALGCLEKVSKTDRT